MPKIGRKRAEGLVLSSVAIAAITFWAWFVFARTGIGTMADRSGTVEALFSGLALVGVVYAILLQRHELALQRRELKLTRNELKRSAESQEKSERNLKNQATSLLFAARLNAVNAMAQGHSILAQHGATSAEDWRSGRERVQWATYQRKLKVILHELTFSINEGQINSIPAFIREEFDSIRREFLYQINEIYCSNDVDQNIRLIDISAIKILLDRTHSAIMALNRQPILEGTVLTKMLSDLENRLDLLHSYDPPIPSYGKIDISYEEKIDSILSDISIVSDYINFNSSA